LVGIIWVVWAGAGSAEAAKMAASTPIWMIFMGSPSDERVANWAPVRRGRIGARERGPSANRNPCCRVLLPQSRGCVWRPSRRRKAARSGPVSFGLTGPWGRSLYQTYVSRVIQPRRSGRRISRSIPGQAGRLRRVSAKTSRHRANGARPKLFRHAHVLRPRRVWSATYIYLLVTN
jgi:hypothetical protein